MLLKEKELKSTSLIRTGKQEKHQRKIQWFHQTFIRHFIPKGRAIRRHSNPDIRKILDWI